MDGLEELFQIHAEKNRSLSKSFGETETSTLSVKAAKKEISKNTMEFIA